MDRVRRSLSTGAPAWCSYYGVTCNSNSTSATYASVTSITLGRLSLAGTIPSNIGSLTLLTSVYLDTNSLAGTIPSTFSKLTSLSLLYLFSNYLTMGSATTVPNTTFSSTTLSGTGLSLGSNCLAFHYGSISVSATHCAPTSGKSVILFEYVCALPMTTAQCFIMYCMDVDVTHI